MQNLRLNGRTNVRVRNFAVGRQPGMLTLLSDPLMPGGTSGDPAVASQIKASASVRAVDVPVVTIDDEVATGTLPPPDLVKIDIEGMELPALQGMSRTLDAHHPDLYLEMHGATMAHKEASVAAIVAFLEAHHYRHILHVESGTPISSANAGVAREGHLFAAFRKTEERPC
jgi:FkbM family methyltransferase